MQRTILVFAAASAAFSGAISATAAAPAALPLKEFMGHVMQRNAEQLWKWTEYVVDGNGEHSGQPRTDEEWEQAESDALTIVQLADVLGGPSYQVEDSRWQDHAASLHAAAAASADAAERKDFTALEAAGEAINARCVACHLTFAPDLEAPPPPS